MWTKEGCNQKILDFAKAFRVQKPRETGPNSAALRWLTPKLQYFRKISRLARQFTGLYFFEDSMVSCGYIVLTHLLGVEGVELKKKKIKWKY